MKIKGIIFDYGGTIDSNGMHWAEVIWRAYQANRVPVEKEIFRNAYVHGERTMGKNPIVQPHHNFLDMLRLKMGLQLDWLRTNGYLPDTTDPASQESLAQWCYAYARQSIERAKLILRALANRYPMVLVSNFYGNIETVLSDFGLDGLFQSIVESAVVGVRKPDPAIFQLGVDRCTCRLRRSLSSETRTTRISFRPLILVVRRFGSKVFPGLLIEVMNTPIA